MMLCKHRKLIAVMICAGVMSNISLQPLAAIAPGPAPERAVQVQSEAPEETEGAEAAALTSRENRIEGDGFDTPEEAITAYCEALKEGDFEKAVSTFAIESYCEHYDYVGQLQRVGFILPLQAQITSNPITPAANETAGQLNIMIRQNQITRQIALALEMAAVNNAALSADEPLSSIAQDIRAGKNIGLFDDNTMRSRRELEELVSAIQQFPDLSGMKLSAPISPLSFAKAFPNYLREQNINNMFRQGVIYGGTGFTERGMLMEDENSIFLVITDLVQYDGKWYNCVPGGFFCSLMGIEMSMQALMGGPKEMITEDDGLFNALRSEGNLEEALAAIEVDPGTFRQEYDKLHEEQIAHVREMAEETGISFDPDRSITEQIDIVKQVYDEAGEVFFRSKGLHSFTILPYEELLRFFGVEDLITQ